MRTPVLEHFTAISNRLPAPLRSRIDLNQQNRLRTNAKCAEAMDVHCCRRQWSLFSSAGAQDCPAQSCLPQPESTKRTESLAPFPISACKETLESRVGTRLSFLVFRPATPPASLTRASAEIINKPRIWPVGCKIFLAGNVEVWFEDVVERFRPPTDLK